MLYGEILTVDWENGDCRIKSRKSLWGNKNDLTDKEKPNLKSIYIHKPG